ncbi:hypothetical protein ACWOFR_05360 [Carnobacterium gallinarum]|uniref:hypothetical protein n=1 Tax=Carnobacterium gallinarum TaxID=2749 RepID=UPI00055188A6|nr:hypothetical protein [Carnobacterium gallinarum]
MIHNLKLGFFQTFTITLIWVTLLSTLFFSNQKTTQMTFWHFIGIAGITGLLFGVLYNLLWNHFTLAFYWNILLSSSFNLIGGFVVVKLFSDYMFELIVPFIFPMFLLELVLHTMVFYVYAKKVNQKKVRELNRLIK